MELGSDDNTFIDVRAREITHRALAVTESTGNTFYGVRVGGSALAGYSQ